MSSLKDKLPVIFTGIIIGVLLILVFFGGCRYQKRVSSISEEYFQQQVEEAQQEAQKWQRLYDSTYTVQAELLVSLDSLEHKLAELKENYVQKITVVKSYTNAECERYFTEHYAEYYGH